MPVLHLFTVLTVLGAAYYWYRKYSEGYTPYGISNEKAPAIRQVLTALAVTFIVIEIVLYLVK